MIGRRRKVEETFIYSSFHTIMTTKYSRYVISWIMYELEVVTDLSGIALHSFAEEFALPVLAWD
jgi:hypothetical protein